MPEYVTGLRQAVRELEQLGVDLDDIKDAFADIANLGAAEVEKLANRRSGRLVASVRGNRAKGKAVVTVGRASVPYAGAVNYGWGRLHSNFKTGKHATGIRGDYAGSHFMQRADERIGPRAVDLLEVGIANAIRKRGF